LLPIGRALLLCFGLSSCASGGSGGDAYQGDDGGTTQPPQDGAPGDATSGSDVAAVDTSTGSDAGFTVDATEASLDDGSTTPDTGAMEAGPSDSSSTCPGHGFTGALVTFDLTGQTGSETSAAAKSSATGVMGGALSRASGLTAVAATGSIDSSGWSLGTTADPTLYYTFTVTPAAGCSVALTSLAIDVKASATGPANVDVGTSVDNYAALSTPVAGTSIGTVTLSASAAAPISVHVFGYGATSSAGTLRIESTMTLSGTIN
jgi:hypothetical protein